MTTPTSSTWQPLAGLVRHLGGVGLPRLVCALLFHGLALFFSRGTLRVFIAEGLRLARTRLIWLAAVSVGAVSALRVKGELVLHATAHNAAVQRALQRGAEPPADPGPANAWAPWIEGWLAGMTLGALLLLVLAARSIAGDRDAGLLMQSTTRSVSRGGLVAGRALLGIPLVLGMIVLTGLTSFLTAGALFEFGPLVEHGYEILAHEELVLETRRAALASVGPLLALWSFGLMVSAITTAPAVSVGLALTGFLGFDLFKQVLGEGQRWVFASFAPSLVDTSAMAELTEVARGFSDAGWREQLWDMNLAIPFTEAILMLVVAWIVTAVRSL